MNELTLRCDFPNIRDSDELGFLSWGGEGSLDEHGCEEFALEGGCGGGGEVVHAENEGWKERERRGEERTRRDSFG